MKRFAGKCALVTGAAGGIGAAIVRMLRAEGAKVAVADRDVGGIEAEAHLPGDLLEPTYADGLPEAACAALGGLDIVVNNAGVITRGKVTETTDADWSLSAGVNVEAPFRICRAAIPTMAASGGGAIINIASCWGLRPGPNHAVYCMTKAAISHLTRCLAVEWGRHGVTVNAVAPTFIRTPGTEAALADPGFRAEVVERIAGLHRIGEPMDVAGAVVFLASPAASLITGTTLLVDGGWTAR